MQLAAGWSGHQYHLQSQSQHRLRTVPRSIYHVIGLIYHKNLINKIHRNKIIVCSHPIYQTMTIHVKIARYYVGLNLTADEYKKENWKNPDSFTKLKDALSDNNLKLNESGPKIISEGFPITLKHITPAYISREGLTDVALVETPY